jgi:hypothetical protein
MQIADIYIIDPEAVKMVSMQLNGYDDLLVVEIALHLFAFE